MFNPIQNPQTVSVSESVSSGFQTISIFMTEKDMKEIHSQANSMNMSVADYIICAGYYNPMVLQMEQIRDFSSVWEDCMSYVSNIENMFTKEMLDQAFSNLYNYIAPLLPKEYLSATSKQIIYGNLYQPPTLTTYDAQAATSFQLEVPDHIFQYFKRCAELMKVNISSYLLYSAIGRVYVIRPDSFEIIFFQLRNIGYLVSDVFNLRDLLLKNLASIWHMFCNAMVVLEINQYQSNYMEFFH